jgi:DNA (cytosine-5)-methyltransferase 1
MRYATVCSGIEAPSVAWEPLGWEAQFFSEIEKFPSAVLAHHYPDVPNLGDMTNFKEWPDAIFDVLCGGTPCQSFSVAGLREGLADPRGNLALTYLAIAARYRPRWLVWENVPGVLSSNGGRDFGALLGALGKLGYGFAYGVRDAQYFGVPQRRRRVFLVGYLGDWRPAAAVFFERESLQGHPPPRREKRENLAPTLAARTRGGGGLGTDFDCDGGLITSHDPACTLTARDYKGPLPEADLSTVVAHSLRGEGFDAGEDGTGRGTPIIPVAYGTSGQFGGANKQDFADPLRASGGDTGNGGETLIAFDCKAGGKTSFSVGEVPGILRGKGHGGGHAAIATHAAVRRLTPIECERLQGFPDSYTDIPYRGRQAADGPRYKALGNSMAVPVMAWIGRRIEMVQSILNAQEAA